MNRARLVGVLIVTAGLIAMLFGACEVSKSQSGGVDDEALTNFRRCDRLPALT